MWLEVTSTNKDAAVIADHRADERFVKSIIIIKFILYSCAASGTEFLLLIQFQELQGLFVLTQEQKMWKLKFYKHFTGPTDGTAFLERRVLCMGNLQQIRWQTVKLKNLYYTKYNIHNVEIAWGNSVLLFSFAAHRSLVGIFAQFWHGLVD